VAVTLLGTCMVACQPQRVIPRVDLMPIQPVTAPSGDYTALAWLPGDLIVAEYEPDPLRDPTHGLWALHLGASSIQALRLPDDEQHPEGRTFFQDPVVLANGRLGYVRSRITKDDAWHTYVLAWDPKTGDSQLLFPYEVPGVGFGAEATLAPDLSHGVMGTTAGIVDQLQWLAGDRASPLELDMARASGAVWSPDGRYVVFKGNRSLSGPLGPAWALQPYHFWLMPAGCGGQAKACAQSLRQLDGAIEGGDLRWSPNGDWLVFAGNPTGQSQGIWLLNVRTQALVQVAQGDYATPEWSPDGRQILVTGPAVALTPGGLASHRQSLYLIDVTKVVQAGAS
jgi:hypothetical protein